MMLCFGDLKIIHIVVFKILQTEHILFTLKQGFFSVQNLPICLSDIEWYALLQLAEGLA